MAQAVNQPDDLVLGAPAVQRRQIVRNHLPKMRAPPGRRPALQTAERRRKAGDRNIGIECQDRKLVIANPCLRPGSASSAELTNGVAVLASRRPCQ